MTVGAAELLRSEFRKVFSLRTWWALGLPPIVIGLLSGAIYGAIASSDVLAGVTDADVLAVTLTAAVTVGAVVLFAAVFGAVHVAGDLRHGSWATSLIAVPRRGRVVSAQLTVSAAVGALYALLSVTAALFSLTVVGGDAVAVSGSLVAGLLPAAVVAGVLWSALGCGLGLLTGSPTWSAVALVAWLPLGESVVAVVASGLGADAAVRLLPGLATVGMVTLGRGPTDLLLPFGAAIVCLLLWATGMAGAGWWRAVMRDVE